MSFVIMRAWVEMKRGGGMKMLNFALGFLAGVGVSGLVVVLFLRRLQKPISWF